MHRRFRENLPATPTVVTPEEGITVLVQQLTHADDAHRRDAVVKILSSAIGPVRAMLIDGLVDLIRDGSASMRLRAAASLTEMGSVAIAALVHRLVSSRSAPLQVRLVHVLGRIGKALPPERRVDIQIHLDIALARARNKSVTIAIAEAQAHMLPTQAELDGVR
jgi:HEAT repeat protein